MSCPESLHTASTVSRLLVRLVARPNESHFAVLHRQDGAGVEVYCGEIVDVETVRDIPLPGQPGAPGAVLAILPFGQVRELGFTSQDDRTPLRCLLVRETEMITLDAALAALPDTSVPAEPLGFDIADSDYAATVARVLDEEIGRGEGANFVIRRDYQARTTVAPAHAALSWLRRLLIQESGAYWSFAVHLGEHTAVGATPERHVSARDGNVFMNPISGTYRYPTHGLDHNDLLRFLTDTKETEELFMVVDEELKMMCRICGEGGQVLGPYLKPMSALAHTEYLLHGLSDQDVRDILRQTMFAPTVTGSPVGNATRVIARHEQSGRGYYAGVLALLTPASAEATDQAPAGTAPPEHRVNLDAPILIRAAHIDPTGNVRIPVGATLVRHSRPDDEVAETRTKASGVLRALGIDVGAASQAGASATPDPDHGAESTAEDAAERRARLGQQSAEHPDVLAALARRNDTLSPFWLNPQHDDPVHGLAGRHAVLVDAEDAWTDMLAQLLRRLGMSAAVTRWTEPLDAAEPDVLVCGPGPGDPRDRCDRRVSTMREIITHRLQSGGPLLAVCLSHQILAHHLHFPVRPLARPYQGTQRHTRIFDHQATLGYYNTFSAYTADRPVNDADNGTGRRLRPAGIEIAADPETREIHALRGPGFISVQGHLESLLSTHGPHLLSQLLTELLDPVTRSGLSGRD